ncbi:MAG: glycosyltransferase family 2 protein [Dehalococcoidales bacterium]|nr:glycosyltransferase family 2 protein [Dehalococcoidales bacterium]
MVSVITSTYNRHDLLLNRCLPSVAAQSYPDIEHVIVSDGPDDNLLEHFGGYGVEKHGVRYFATGRRYNDWGVSPKNAALLLSAGDYIAYLDDDNKFLPEHIEKLVDLLEQTGADLVYSKFLWLPEGIVRGTPELRLGQIDTSVVLHRRELLAKGLWLPKGHGNDFYTVANWVAQGARYAFLDEVTMKYYYRKRQETPSRVC